MSDERAGREQTAPREAPPAPPDATTGCVGRSDHDARWSRLQEALEKHFGPLRLTAARPLGGGISAHTFAVDFEGTMRETATVVVKLPRLGPKRERQRAARYEYQVLALLRGTGIGAPQPLLLDVAGSILGQPGLVMEYLAGEVDVSPFDGEARLRQMATRLAQIHRLPLQPLATGTLARHLADVLRIINAPPTRLDHTLNEATVRHALVRAQSRLQPDRLCLLHGDYWPGNLLWSNGRLVGVLDWEEAAIGDPAADLAITRLDVLWALGEHAMQCFTEAYTELCPDQTTHLPVWDLVAALRPMSRLGQWAAALVGPPIHRPDLTQETLAALHQSFVEQALAHL